MKILVFLLSVLMINCANTSEEDRLESQHEREDRLILAKEEFERRKVACRMAGGMMQIERRSREFDVHDYRFARCVK